MRKTNRICTVEGCDNKHNAKGYCSKHYSRVYAHGTTKYLGKKKRPEHHGLVNTPEYHVWERMKQRCYDVNQKDYYRYGGRGITVCNRWLESFLNFLEDVGEKPFLKAEFDRNDSNKNYDKSNCRWVNETVQSRNRDCVKLSMEKARAIRLLYSKGNITHKILGYMFGVSRVEIGYVIRNIHWLEGKA